MKKILYYLCYIILLFLISMIPVSAKEIKMCTRSTSNLHVREEFIKNNISDIMSTPCVDDVDKIYDFGNLLTDEEEEKLYNEVENFIETTNYDLVIVTINENNKGSSRVYADDFYDYNAFGKNDTRDGLLLLIDMDKREVYISTTGYAIKMYDDARLGIKEEYYDTDSVIDAGYNNVKNKEYYNAFSNMVKKLLEFYYAGYPTSNSNIEIDELGKIIIVKYISYPLVIFIASIITLIVSIIFYSTSRLKIKVVNVASYMKDKNINIKNDMLINSVVTHTLRSTDTSSGSSGGGSSYHSSSSGSFHGGGGRGF